MVRGSRETGCCQGHEGVTETLLLKVRETSTGELKPLETEVDSCEKQASSHMSRGKGRGRGCGRGTGLGLGCSQAPVQEETDDMFREEVGPRWWLMSDRAPETA